jgi:hypothetical protein
MTETNVTLPQPWNVERLVRHVEAAFARNGLHVALKDTLRTHPGCIHWQLKEGEAAGTLEFTLWPDRQRAWFKVHPGRTAAWVDRVLPALKAALEQPSIA